jgi:hypothetical protein
MAFKIRRLTINNEVYQNNSSVIYKSKIGPKGAKSDLNGPTGQNGPTGGIGFEGSTGSIGCTGENGKIGDLSSYGITGPSGYVSNVIGSTGSVGNTGPVISGIPVFGPEGASGITGFTGITGTIGEDNYTFGNLITPLISKVSTLHNTSNTISLSGNLISDYLNLSNEVTKINQLTLTYAPLKLGTNKPNMVSSFDGKYLCICGNNILYRSEDYGKTFTSVIFDTDLFAVSMNYYGDIQTLISSNIPRSSFYISLDYGVTWTETIIQTSSNLWLTSTIAIDIYNGLSLCTGGGSGPMLIREFSNNYYVRNDVPFLNIVSSCLTIYGIIFATTNGEIYLLDRLLTNFPNVGVNSEIYMTFFDSILIISCIIVLIIFDFVN